MATELPRKGAYPQFSAHVCCGQRFGWIKMPLGTEVDLGPGHTVLHGDPSTPRKGAQQPPTFRPMSIVAKRSPISATAELLFIKTTTRRYMRIQLAVNSAPRLRRLYRLLRWKLATHYVPGRPPHVVIGWRRFATPPIRRDFSRICIPCIKNSTGSLFDLHCCTCTFYR